jgi:hypothetical protein
MAEGTGFFSKSQGTSIELFASKFQRGKKEETV